MKVPCFVARDGFVVLGGLKRKEATNGLLKDVISMFEGNFPRAQEGTTAFERFCSNWNRIGHQQTWGARALWPMGRYENR